MSTVHVTAEHIAAGVIGDGSHCPIANAIRDCCPDFTDIEVSGPGIDVWDSWGKHYEARVPGISGFIGDFDHGGQVYPFEFTPEWIDDDGVAA